MLDFLESMPWLSDFCVEAYPSEDFPQGMTKNTLTLYGETVFAPQAPPFLNQGTITNLIV